ncbi:MAG TPA: CoA pyrophosphatase [Polyangia bacterium]|nr:CoA pyrophosphatase [Polyangia bacterium]
MTLEGFRPAAVLAPVVVRADELTLLLTERTSDLPSHAGQVAFPGGKIDATDRDAAACAVREAAEELGLAPAQAEVLGRLDDLPTPTGFVISPVVALVRAEPLLHPNPSEVASFFYAPLEALRDPSCFEVLGVRELLGVHYELYAYRFEGHTIWGATARMVKRILELAYS